MKKIIVGSTAFFNDIEGFVPKDLDTVNLIDNPTKFKYHRQIKLNGHCIFEWKRMSIEEFREFHKNCKCGMMIGKFLVPEFANEIGMTIEDLKTFEFLFDYIDEKHEYERDIYNSYLENNGFFLTEEQKKKAYKTYLDKHDTFKNI